jgi:hypothetical protein
VGEQEYQKSNLGIKFPNSTLESQCNKSLQKKKEEEKKIIEETHFILTPCAQPNPCLISDVSNQRE